jgi:hypothetical protein
LLAQDILNVCEDTLDDPTNTFWSSTELLAYLNQFCRWAMGLKPDLVAYRTLVNLAAGSYQQIPADGFQFLDAYFAGNGQAVFVRNLEEVKHAKFANATATGQTAFPTVVALDPRDPQRYFVFPPSNGESASTLEILYAQRITPMAETTSTYVLPDETADTAYWYVLALAYRKATDRQDLDRAGICYQNATAWFGLRTQVQFGMDAKED